MSYQDGHQADPRRTSLVPGGQLREAEGLQLVTVLNRRCLEVMVRLARSDEIRMPAALSENRALWRGLDPAGCERAASRPILLADVKFSDPRWWRGAAEGAAERKGAVAGYVPARAATELMRETMTLAWVLVRADQGLATALCGMAPPVARLFSSFTPLDVERLSARHHHHLRLRFDDNPTYWRMHLKTAKSRTESAAPSRDAVTEGHPHA